MSNFDKNFEAARLAMLAKQHSDIVKVKNQWKPMGSKPMGSDSIAFSV